MKGTKGPSGPLKQNRNKCITVLRQGFKKQKRQTHLPAYYSGDGNSVLVNILLQASSSLTKKRGLHQLRCLAVFHYAQRLSSKDSVQVSSYPANVYWFQHIFFK